MKVLVPPQSGSYAGVTSSRNSYGQYIRTRATPVNPGTTFQSDVRARLALVASSWRSLTPSQQAGWRDLSLQISRTDSLGQSYTPSGFGAYNLANLNLLASGGTLLADAPLYNPPAAVESATLTAVGGTPALSLAFTPSALDTGNKLMAWLSPQQSAGRYFNGQYRLIAVGADATSSPMNLLSAYTARSGVPITGNKIFASVTVTNGPWVSSPVICAAIVS